MPRQARLELPGVSMYVTQRGVNRCAIFIDDEDHHHYRRLLREACRKHDVAVHAFVLMDNHVHLLLSAGQHPLYLSLGHDPMQRAETYGTWLRSGIGEDELADVRRHIVQERALNRPATCRPRGRPRRQLEEGN